MEATFKDGLRTWVGAKDYAESRSFYETLGWSVSPIDERCALVRVEGQTAFYLQDYYVKDWVENSMLLLEVDDLDAYHKKVMALKLPESFPGVRITKISENDWGREFHLIDPAGVLWHFVTFTT